MNDQSRMIKSMLASLWLVLLIAGCSSGASTPQSLVESTESPVAAATSASQPSAVPTNALATGQAELPVTGQNVSQAAALTKLNLNTATEADFLSIPGMGNRMVREFLEYRPYTSIEQFRREIGKYVSDDQVAEYEQYVYVPVSVNEADAATLMQIPGLDETEAQALIDARPFASNDAFLSALAAYVSTDELAVAANYLDTP